MTRRRPNHPKARSDSKLQKARHIADRPVKDLLMGPSALDAKRYYSMASMEITEEFSDLPDHVGLELHYLGRLGDKERKFAEAGDEGKLTRAWELERDFLASHLTRWLDKLCEKIHEKSKHPYYRVIANMAVEFTHRNLTTLEAMLGKSAARPLTDFAEAESQ